MEATISVVSVAIILITPLLESFGISCGFVENPIVRILLILFIVYAVRLGHMPGLLAFLAAYSLLIERNHEVLTLFPNQKPRWPTAAYGFPIKAAPLTGIHEEIPFDTPHVPDAENHEEEHHAKADDLHDNIPRMKEAPNMSEAPEFYKSKGLV